MNLSACRVAVPTPCILPVCRSDYCVPGEHPSSGYEPALALAMLSGPIQETRRPDARAVACAWHISCRTQTGPRGRCGLRHVGHARQQAFVSALLGILEPFPRSSRCECRRKFLELFSDIGSNNQCIVREVQQEQHRRIASQRQLRPLAETIYSQIKIASLGAGACVPVTFGGGPIHPLLKLAKTNHVSTRFNTHSHFISIVCTSKHQAVNSRANQSLKDGCCLSNQAVRNVIIQQSDVILPLAIYPRVRDFQRPN